MILKNISLHNYRQHRDLDVSFTGHMIAVLGRNGSGKSNFLGAIQFALTGEQPGFNKEDLLNWDAAKSQEGGFVDLSFDHNGVECRIQRRIEKPAVTLTVGGEKFSGTKKVQEQLELMGIDKDVLRQSVFVRQTEVESVLFDDPRERELAFQKLVGLGDAAKHQKFLTDFLAALAEPKNMADEIETKKASIAYQKQELADLEAKSGEMDATLHATVDEAQIQERIELLNKRIGLVENALTTWDAFDSVTEKLKKAESEYGDEAAKDEIDTSVLNKQIGELNARVDSAKGVSERNRRRRETADKLRVHKAALDRMPNDLDAVAKEKADKTAELNTLSGRIEQLYKLVRSAPDGNVCPLCGSTTDHNIKAEIEGELAEAQRRVNELNKWINENKGVNELIQERARREESVKRLEESVNEMGPEEPEQDVDEISKTVDSLYKSLLAADGTNVRISNAKAKIEYAKMAVEQTGQTLKDNLTALPGSHSRDELRKACLAMKDSRTAAFASLSELSELKAQKAALDGEIRQVRQFVKEAEKALADLERVNEENMVKASKIQVVRDVKDWFSYKNGPRVMSQAVMGMLVDETNKFLGQFGAPFTVVPMEEGMGFRVLFTDGRAMSEPPPEATMLSGGQKITLAVAFRFAVYMMFSSKLGLLSLDEPTAYLDDETIARFADLLGKIRDLASNMGVQCIVSTHEASLGPAFDQTIVIGK